MKYFVTGATGFVGGRVVGQLRELGHEVVALVRNPDSAAHLTEAGVILHRGDLNDCESLRSGMQGVDGVFHIAGWYKLRRGKDPEAVRVNVDGTRNVLETMRELRIAKGVYTSTVAVFSDTGGKLVDEDYRFRGRHLTQYDHTKAVAHYDVAEPMMQAGLPLVVVMPGVVYGPGDHSPVHELFVRYLKKNLPAIPRKTAYCWNHIDDTARAHLLAMEKGTPGKSYVIAGPRRRFGGGTGNYGNPRAARDLSVVVSDARMAYVDSSVAASTAGHVSTGSPAGDGGRHLPGEQ